MKQNQPYRRGHRYCSRAGNRHPYCRRSGLRQQRSLAQSPVNRNICKPHLPHLLPRKHSAPPFCRRGPTPERGFSLIELGIVFLIISLVVIGVYSKATSISDEANIQRAVDDTLLLLNKATAFRSNNGSYTGVTISILGTRGYTTAPMTDGDGENPWGRDYTLAANAGGDILSLTIDTGNAALCARLASTLDGLVYNQQSLACANNIVTATVR